MSIPFNFLQAPTLNTLAFPDQLSAKGKLIRAAEHLFAQKGIEATSLREISQLAEQKNTNAVQYHFGNKQALINAIWQRHAMDIQLEREKYLKTLESNKNPALNTLMKAIIFPIANKMSDSDGGRDYIQIMSYLISYSEISLLELFQHSPDKTTQFIIEAIEPHISHLSDTDKKARSLFVVGAVFHSMADYIRLSDNQSPLSKNLNPSDVIENLIIMLSAAISS